MKIKLWRKEMERVSRIEDVGERNRLRDAGYEKVFRYIRRKRKKFKKAKKTGEIGGIIREHAHYDFVPGSSNPSKYVGSREGCPYCIRDEATARRLRKRLKKKKMKEKERRLRKKKKKKHLA